MRQTVVQCQRRSTATAVAYIDLDGFKEVNDTYGHAAGDILLATVAQRMQQALREGDTLARMGGDEFVALLIDLGSGGDCETILERLLQAAAEPVVFDTAVLKVSASIGVAIYPRDGQNAERLLEAADQAMYQAKRTGRNRYHLLASE